MKSGWRTVFELAVVVSFAGSAAALEDPFSRALNVYGATGFAAVPHADVLPHKRWALGIHNFSPEAVVALPLIPAELGAMTMVREKSELERVLKEMSVSLKLKALNESLCYFNLAVGLECSETEKPRCYLVVDRGLPYLFGRLVAGYGRRENRGRLHGVFYGMGVTVYRGLQMLGEYDGDDVNVGLRLMLSPRIKIDALCLGLGRLKEQANVRSIFDNNVNFGFSIDMAMRRPWKKAKRSN